MNPRKLFFKFLLLTPLLVTACGERTSIQPGEVGKQLTTAGLEEAIREPGAFRMDACFTNACPKLVRLQVNKAAVDVKIDSLFLPKSNVDLTNVMAGVQFRVKPIPPAINQAFEEVRPVQAASLEGNQNESDRVLIITADMVWDTFGKRKAPDAIVTALREYTVDQVLVNVPEIAEFTKGKINQILKDTPIEVTELGFPNGVGDVPPAVIESKRKLFAIEDDKAREIASLEAALSIEDQRQAVARKRASNDREIAGQLGISVGQYQCLGALDDFADAALKGTMVVFSGDCGLSNGHLNNVLPIPQK